MRVVTDVVTGEVDPGACVWCREWAVRCSIAVRGYAAGGKKRPRSRKEGEDNPRKKPRSEGEEKSKGKEVDPRERDGLRMILEDEVERMDEEGEVPQQEPVGATEPVASGSGARKETSGEEAPVARGSEARLETSVEPQVEETTSVRIEGKSEVEDLVSVVRELTEVVREGFKEIREANRLQRLVNEDILEKIRNKNWRKYERMARREE